MKILSTLPARLRQDCHGFIVSTELMLLGSIVFFGLIAAFAATREAVISELSDVAGFSQDFNQSFSYNGATGASGETAGSDYLDQLDIADDAEDLAGQADNGILFNAAPLNEFVAAVAEAATFSGTGGTSSEAALSGGTLVSFDGAAAGVSNTFTDGDLTIDAIGGSLTIGSDFNGLFNTTGGLSLFNGRGGGFSQLDFSFGGGTVSAFGFQFGASNQDWTLTASDADGGQVESFVITELTNSNSGDYFGVTGAGIASISLVGSSRDFVFVDELVFEIE